MRHATDIGDAFKAALTLGKVEDAHEDSKRHVVYPSKVLAMLWAKARQLGQLGATMPDRTGHASYAFARAEGGTVHNALVRMARASGHADLAHAMAESAERHKLAAKPRETYETEINNTWPGHAHAAARFKRALAAAEAGGFADEPKVTGFVPGYDADRNKTKRQFLTEKIAESIAHADRQAIKEAA